MAQLTANRDTPEYGRNDSRVLAYAPVASDEFYVGGLVGIDSADGKLKPAAAALTTLTMVGRCEERYTSPASPPADKVVRVKSGTFLFGNSAAADLIAADDIGANCYAVDDNIVGLTNGGGTRSVAGKIENVDSDGVWVSIKPF